MTFLAGLPGIPLTFHEPSALTFHALPCPPAPEGYATAAGVERSLRGLSILSACLLFFKASASDPLRLLMGASDPFQMLLGASDLFLMRSGLGAASG